MDFVGIINVYFISKELTSFVNVLSFKKQVLIKSSFQSVTGLSAQGCVACDKSNVTWMLKHFPLEIETHFLFASHFLGIISFLSKSYYTAFS